MTNREKTGLAWMLIGIFLLVAAKGSVPVVDVAACPNEAFPIASLLIWLGGLGAFLRGLWRFTT